MQKNHNKIVILVVFFLASTGLWVALFLGVPIGSFPSFGFLNRYREWEQSQNESVSILAKEGALSAISTFLNDTAVDRKNFAIYFIDGEKGRLLLLTSIEEAGRRLGATTTIVSVGERSVVPPKKKTPPKTSQAGFVAGRKLAQTTSDDFLNNGPTSFFDITVTARGTFEAVYRFVHTLEALPFILTVNQSNLRLLSDGAKDKAGSTWEGSFQITVQSFTKKTI